MFKVAILGPESTGKSTLAQQLAKHYNASLVPEYSREYLASIEHHYDINDIINIAKGQQRNIEIASKEPSDILLTDTEAIVNKVWCEYVFGNTPEEIEQLVQNQQFDLYLLCNVDLEWSYDPLRENPSLDERKAIYDLYLKELNELKRRFVVISGQDEDRLHNAIEAIDALRNKHHIVFLARWYPHKYDPMFGLFVQRHAEAIALYNKVSVVYIHADTNAKNTYDIERNFENGVDTIRIYYKKTDKITSAIRFWKSCQLALKQIDKPDLIHVHVLTRLGVVALWEKLRHHTPYMITEHWSRYLPGNDFKGELRRLLTRIVVQKASMVTTVTEDLAAAMKRHKLKNDNYTILPNVVDTTLFSPKPHTNKVPEIIHISCFEDKSKNISGLLHSLSLLKKDDTPFHATLIGDGMDFDTMRHLADQLQLNDCVSFTGMLQGSALVNELASGDFLVLSSNYENMPVVILEALACGLPVVSTKVGGIAEIINDTNGILVPARDQEALKKALKQMCMTYKSYNAEALRQSIITRYGSNEVGLLLTKWYKKICKE